MKRMKSVALAKAPFMMILLKNHILSLERVQKLNGSIEKREKESEKLDGESTFPKTREDG